MGMFGAAHVIVGSLCIAGEAWAQDFPAASKPFLDFSLLGKAALCHPGCWGNKRLGDCRKLRMRSVYLKCTWSESRFKQWQGARKMCWRKEDEEGRGADAWPLKKQPGLGRAGGAAGDTEGLCQLSWQSLT